MCQQPHVGSVDWLIRDVIHGSQPRLHRGDEEEKLMVVCDQAVDSAAADF